MLMICPWASVRGGPRFTSYIAYYNMNDDPKIEKKNAIPKNARDRIEYRMMVYIMYRRDVAMAMTIDAHV